MPLRTNKMRELMRQSKPTLGTHVLSTWASEVEIVGLTGLYDYVEFTSQYAPYDLHDLENLARATELHGLSSMIKVDPEPRTYLAQRAVGAGFQGVLFADLKSVAEVEEAVKIVRAEPKGINGTAMNRASGFLYGGTDEFVRYADDVVVAIMMEKRELFEKVEDVMNTPGVDMIQFGAYDFALSLGMPGGFAQPKVVEAQEKTIKLALKYDKHPRIELGQAERAEKWIAMGVRDFCMGWDILVWHEFLKNNGTTLRSMLSKA